MKAAKFTARQTRQQRLAWMLFVTEGYIANMHGFGQFNFSEFKPATQVRIRTAVEKVIVLAEEVRAEMQQLGDA